VAEKSVAGSFDAYHRWLGIPPKDQPPNHYRLLTLDPFESDPDVIEAAADRQMGHLRTYQTGPHSDLSQKLLNEVAAAKVCLLNPRKKAEYDARLRPQLAVPSFPAGGPAAVGIDPEVAGAIRQSDRGASAGLPPGMAGTVRPNLGVLVGIVSAVGAALLLVIAITLWPKDSQRPPAEESVAAANSSGAPAAGPNRPEQPEKAKSPIAAPPPVKPQPTELRQPAIYVFDGQWRTVESPPAAKPGGPDLWKGLPKTDEPTPVPGPKVAADEKMPPSGKEPLAGGTSLPGQESPLPSPPPSEPKLEKAAVPAEAEQEKARKLVLEVYQKQYDRAATPEDQIALARKLLDKVQQEEIDPPGRFILLVMARELAERARHWGTAVEAIDELNAGFRIDAAEMKTEVLEGFAKLARTLPEHALIAEAALPLVDEAAAQANVALAGRIAKLAQAEAGKARNRELQIAARASAKQAQELAKVAKDVEAAREALKLNPQDPAANLVLGRFLCFVRGDWAGGLPCLAASSDESLKALAQKDLARPASPADMVPLGNQWWDLGEKDQAAGQKPCRLRAAHWYRASLDGLAPGLERDMVQKRVQEAAALEESSASGHDAKKGPFRAYEGTWIVGFTTGKGRRYVIDAGGDVSWGPFRGRLTRRNDDLVIEFSGGTVDRIKLGGDQLQVEHFDSAAAYPAQPAWQGKARRLKKDPEETAARLFRPLQGLWLIQYSNKAARAYAIDAKGNVLAQDLDANGKIVPQTNKQGQLTVHEGEVLLGLQNGMLERLERYGRGLWVEQFHPPTEYPHTIWLFGLGVRK
jgi:hypothetical protein